MWFDATSNAHSEINVGYRKKLDTANWENNCESSEKLSKTLNHRSKSKFILYLHVQSESFEM